VVGLVASDGGFELLVVGIGLVVVVLVVLGWPDVVGPAPFIEDPAVVLGTRAVVVDGPELVEPLPPQAATVDTKTAMATRPRPCLTRAVTRRFIGGRRPGGPFVVAPSFIALSHVPIGFGKPALAQRRGYSERGDSGRPRRSPIRRPEPG
jgi:hypothetical protein